MDEIAICPNCGNENRMDANFCKNCCFTIGNKAQTSVKFCPKCKNPNRPSARFCSVCGHSFIQITFSGPLSTGSILVNRYEIINLIKAGGMGAVYKARDHRMLELCAVKELIADSINTEQEDYTIKRFNEEGNLLANLIHPNLPRVTDLFIEKGRYYLVMELIDGKDLDTVLKERNKLSIAEAIQYGLQILDVLDYLHNQNPPIVYRDLKPANIVIRTRDQRAMLIDFGIARTIQIEEEKKTRIGTPQYSPIEQFKGMVEPASDIYALGRTMHHLITGVAPEPMSFHSEPLTNFVPEAHKELEAIITKATQPDIKDRYSKASEMIKDIKNFLNKENISGPKEKIDITKPDSISEQKAKPRKATKILTPLKEEEETENKKETIKKERNNKKDKITIISKSEKTKKIVSSILKSDLHLDIHPSSTEMVLIPSGYFWMGDSGCEYDENRKKLFETNKKGQHRVYLNAYYIDITPVTNEQYKIFVQENSYKSEGDWEKYFTKDKEHHPVVNITWYDADTYATWAKKRLLTEAEWEKASRGGDGRNWPWGNLWDDTKLNSRESGPGRTTEVHQYSRGDSIYGVLDTVGNVWEWTSDWYYPYPYEGPYISEEGDKRVIRGGSYSETKDKCTCSFRNWGFPENKSAFRGFRCGKDVK
ncbi:MAG TPA: SUMF1/EgtB/PvdO family nonheme iron enzyme [Candidatus Eremiobacteraeota bacterium]|nr:MAG: Serine/threonine-protein kinase pkn1 [bacterium ADurb.Bin363]HPZ08411.1 SUMF1/EgtB/PvdO family nonheme iron enzyme [Candidatus Eremiobacteraeota bacterium]